LLPNGNVLMMTSPGIFNTGAEFFEWDGSNLNPVPGSPNAPNDSSFYGNMLVLPTGQILFTDFFEVDIYTPTGSYDPAWAPTIQKIPSTVSPSGSYVISGHKFNGFSQGAAYGDDAQAATNYPLVRITNRANRTRFLQPDTRPQQHGRRVWGAGVHAFRCASQSRAGRQ